MDHTEAWSEIKSFVDEREHFLITSHVSPDGDAIGSEMALALTLRKLGKSCEIVNSSPTPYNYIFLDPDGEIEQYSAGKHLGNLKSVEGSFILDISDWGRLREIGKVIRDLDVPRVCIDHHRQTDDMAPIEVIDPTASCTGELLYDFLKFIGEQPQGRVAEGLYTCLLTDTGSFRFSNTTPRVHNIVAELLGAGVDQSHVYQEVYENCSQAKLRLMGEVMQGLNYDCEGKIAWFLITKNRLRESGAKSHELETLPEIPKTVAGVEVSAIFTELNHNRTKISLRSRGRIPISEVAIQFGGGGHLFAAGAAVQEAPDQVVPKVLEELKHLVNSFPLESAGQSDLAAS